MKKTATGIFCLLLAFIMPYSLGGQEIKTVGGVKVIQNGKKPHPAKGLPSRVRLVEELVVGQGDNPDEALSDLSTFVVDEQGNIHALDFKERRIKVYDASGKFLRLIGKPGQGPGELGLPTGVLLTPEGHLLVEDAVNRRLAIFQTDGVFLKHVSLADKMGLVNLIQDTAGNFLGREIGLTAGNKMFFEIKKYDKDMKPVFSIGKIEFAIPIPGSGAKINFMEMMSVYQFDGRGNIYYSPNQEYEVKVFAPDGKHIRSIRKEHLPLKVTKEDVEEMLSRMPDMGMGVNVGEMFEFPEHFSPFQYFALDEQGRMYVRTWNKGKNKREYWVDVFDPEGRYIAQFATKADLRLCKDGKIYGLDETEDGLKVIKRYAVLWEK